MTCLVWILISLSFRTQEATDRPYCLGVGSFFPDVKQANMGVLFLVAPSCWLIVKGKQQDNQPFCWVPAKYMLIWPYGRNNWLFKERCLNTLRHRVMLGSHFHAPFVWVFYAARCPCETALQTNQKERRSHVGSRSPYGHLFWFKKTPEPLHSTLFATIMEVDRALPQQEGNLQIPPGSFHDCWKEGINR